MKMQDAEQQHLIWRALVLSHARQDVLAINELQQCYLSSFNFLNQDCKKNQWYRIPLAWRKAVLRDKEQFILCCKKEQFWQIVKHSTV